MNEEAGDFAPKIAWWDSPRLEDSEEQPLLKANCEKPEVNEARKFGLSPGSAVCGVCQLREDCDLQQGRRLAINADHVVVSASTIAWGGPEVFADRDLILVLDDTPDSVLKLSVSSEGAAYVSATLAAALTVLLGDPGFRSGQSPIGGAADDDLGRALLRWATCFRDKVLPNLGEDKRPFSGKPPRFAIAWLFKAMGGLDVQLGHDRKLTPFLIAAEDRNASVSFEPEFVDVSACHQSNDLPVVSLVTERPPLGSDCFELVEPDCQPPKSHQVAVQHVIPLSPKCTDKRFQGTLRGIVSEYRPAAAVVVCAPERHQAFKGVNDRRIRRILTFEGASVAKFEQDEFVICLGVPSVHDIEVRRELLVKRSDEHRAINLEFGPQVLGLEGSAGGFSDVLILGYSDIDAATVHARLIRKKLGCALLHSQTVVVSDQLIGLPLAAHTLRPESETTYMIRKILEESESPISISQLGQICEERGVVIDRRNRQSEIRRVLSHPDYVEITPCQTAHVCHLVPLIKSRLTAPHDILARKWFRRSEFAEAISIATKRTAQVALKKLTTASMVESNGLKGRAVQYRLTEEGQAKLLAPPEPTHFRTSAGRIVLATPPASWNGADTLVTTAASVQETVTPKSMVLDGQGFTAKVEIDWDSFESTDEVLRRDLQAI